MWRLSLLGPHWRVIARIMAHRAHWFLVVILTACGGAKDEPDGGNPLPDAGMPMIDANGSLPDASGSSELDLRVPKIEAERGPGDIIRCLGPNAVAGECALGTGGVIETKYATITLTGVAATTSGGGTVTLTINGTEVPVGALGAFTYVYTATETCAEQSQEFPLHLVVTSPTATAPAELTVTILHDACPPVVGWPTGAVDFPFDTVEKELLWPVSYTTPNYYPCMWKKKTPGAADLIALDPAITPVVTKYRSNLRGESGNSLIGGCTAGPFAVNPPDPGSYEQAGANEIHYRFGLQENTSRDVSVHAVVETPSGATREITQLVSPNSVNPLDRKFVPIYFTAEARTGTDLNVVVPELESETGTYEVSVEVTDHLGHSVDLPPVAWSHVYKSGPIHPPVHMPIPTSGSLLQVPVLQAALLQGANNAGVYFQAGTYFVVKNLAVHNRTLFPVTMSASGSGVQGIYWTYERWRYTSAPYFVYVATNTCRANDTLNWPTGKVAPDPAGQNGHLLGYAAASPLGTACVTGDCSTISAPARNETQWIVAMSGLSELAFGDDRSGANGRVYGSVDSSAKTAGTEEQSGTCPADVCADESYACVDTGGPVGVCRRCRETRVDRLYVMKTLSLQAVHFLFLFLEGEAWTSLAFDPFTGYFAEDSF